jgi:hypothetical protein
MTSTQSFPHNSLDNVFANYHYPAMSFGGGFSNQATHNMAPGAYEQHQMSMHNRQQPMKQETGYQGGSPVYYSTPEIQSQALNMMPISEPNYVPVSQPLSQADWMSPTPAFPFTSNEMQWSNMDSPISYSNSALGVSSAALPSEYHFLSFEKTGSNSAGANVAYSDTSSNVSDEFASYGIQSESSPRMPLPSSILASPVQLPDTGGVYSCTYINCPERFETPEDLQAHKRKIHQGTHSGRAGGHARTPSADTQNGPHICRHRSEKGDKQLCNATFSRPYDLTRHEHNLHDPSKVQLRCPVCPGKKFSRGDALSRHMRDKHPGVHWTKPGRASKRPTNAQRHIRKSSSQSASSIMTSPTMPQGYYMGQ